MKRRVCLLGEGCSVLCDYLKLFPPLQYLADIMFEHGVTGAEFLRYTPEAILISLNLNTNEEVLNLLSSIQRQQSTQSKARGARMLDNIARGFIVGVEHTTVNVFVIELNELIAIDTKVCTILSRLSQRWPFDLLKGTLVDIVFEGPLDISTNTGANAYGRPSPSVVICRDCSILEYIDGLASSRKPDLQDGIIEPDEATSSVSDYCPIATNTSANNFANQAFSWNRALISQPDLFEEHESTSEDSSVPNFGTMTFLKSHIFQGSTSVPMAAASIAGGPAQRNSTGTSLGCSSISRSSRANALLFLDHPDNRASESSQSQQAEVVSQPSNLKSKSLSTISALGSSRSAQQKTLSQASSSKNTRCITLSGTHPSASAGYESYSECASPTANNAVCMTFSSSQPAKFIHNPFQVKPMSASPVLLSGWCGSSKLARNCSQDSELDIPFDAQHKLLDHSSVIKAPSPNMIQHALATECVTGAQFYALFPRALSLARQDIKEVLIDIVAHRFVGRIEFLLDGIGLAVVPSIAALSDYTKPRLADLKQFRISSGVSLVVIFLTNHLQTNDNVVACRGDFIEFSLSTSVTGIQRHDSVGCISTNPYYPIVLINRLPARKHIPYGKAGRSAGSFSRSTAGNLSMHQASSFTEVQGARLAPEQASKPLDQAATHGEGVYPHSNFSSSCTQYGFAQTFPAVQFNTQVSSTDVPLATLPSPGWPVPQGSSMASDFLPGALSGPSTSENASTSFQSLRLLNHNNPSSLARNLPVEKRHPDSDSFSLRHSPAQRTLPASEVRKLIGTDMVSHCTKRLTCLIPPTLKDGHCRDSAQSTHSTPRSNGFSVDRLGDEYVSLFAKNVSLLKTSTAKSIKDYHRELHVNDMECTGIVYSFNEYDEYGFIKSYGTNAAAGSLAQGLEVYFNTKVCQTEWLPQKGDVVSFRAKWVDNKPQCTNVYFLYTRAQSLFLGQCVGIFAPFIFILPIAVTKGDCSLCERASTDQAEDKVAAYSEGSQPRKRRCPYSRDIHRPCDPNWGNDIYYARTKLVCGTFLRRLTVGSLVTFSVEPNISTHVCAMIKDVYNIRSSAFVDEEQMAKDILRLQKLEFCTKVCSAESTSQDAGSLVGTPFSTNWETIRHIFGSAQSSVQPLAQHDTSTNHVISNDTSAPITAMPAMQLTPASSCTRILPWASLFEPPSCTQPWMTYSVNFSVVLGSPFAGLVNRDLCLKMGSLAKLRYYHTTYNNVQQMLSSHEQLSAYIGCVGSHRHDKPLGLPPVPGFLRYPNSHEYPCSGAADTDDAAMALTPRYNDTVQHLADSIVECASDSFVLSDHELMGCTIIGLLASNKPSCTRALCLEIGHSNTAAVHGLVLQSLIHLKLCVLGWSREHVIGMVLEETVLQPHAYPGYCQTVAHRCVCQNTSSHAPHCPSQRHGTLVGIYRDHVPSSCARIGAFLACTIDTRLDELNDCDNTGGNQLDVTMVPILKWPEWYSCNDPLQHPSQIIGRAVFLFGSTSPVHCTACKG